MTAQLQAVKLNPAMTRKNAEGSQSSSAPSRLTDDKIVRLPGGASDSIRQITTRMQERDEAAFGEFYERYCDRLYRFLLLLTRGNESHSRDLLQATMIKVMQRIRPFSDEAH